MLESLADQGAQLGVDIVWERGLTGAQARELAAVLVEAADEIDRWAGEGK